MKITRSLFVLALTLLALALGGCYRNEEVSESQVGLVMTDGVSIDKDGVKYTGRYSQGSTYWARIVIIDTSTKTLKWSDPDLITSDKQVIGVDVGVSYRRSRDAEIVRRVWSEYPAEAQDDTALAILVDSRMARTMKNLTADYTLDELISTAANKEKDRTTATNEAFAALNLELAEFGAELIDLGINNVTPSDTYRASLDAKAQAIVDVEVSQKQTLFLQEKLAQEKAQTAIALEQADRDNKVAMIEAQLLTQSPEAFELEKIKAMAAIFGPQDKIYFLQPGTDISAFFGSPATTIPVATESK